MDKIFASRSFKIAFKYHVNPSVAVLHFSIFSPISIRRLDNKY